MTDLDDDGTVLIDWNMVEQMATSTTDPRRSAAARLMLAIRDGHWKPMTLAPIKLRRAIL
ncbi:hypothetical protein [Tardiphaga sp.]|uniref:hypothetical protein n=1 Tax=Tardiphaga sp. TaxID=1926292 RepID=UPI0026225E5A|nr:hypothetical protein [Tardiphaga sp.]